MPENFRGRQSREDETSNDELGVSFIMKIETIRATPIRIPMSYIFRWGPGAYDGFTRTVIEVETSAGLVGIGESGFGRDASIVEETIAPRLIGANPLDLNECERRAIPPYATMLTSRDVTPLHAYAGVEMALWDIAGKATNRSLASLLGGRVRDNVSFSEYFAFEEGSAKDVSALAESCSQALENYGATVLEGKIGVMSLRDELGLVTAIRDAIGGITPIRLDPNMSWDVATAREALPVLADLGVTWIEEPVMTQTELRRLRGLSPISFSTHQIDLQSAVRDQVPDAFVVKVDYLGGIRRTVDFINACSLFGIAVWFRAPSAGITNAAELQISAALAPITHPSQNLSRWLGDDVVEQGPLHASGGFVAVPDEPGLGVTLDKAAFARCAERARSA
jgi:glucarate dehydratase